MNLSINQPNYLDKTNYNSNTNFHGKNVKGVFKRTANEIADFISYSKERLDGRDSLTIAEQLSDMVGKCLGNKYLMDLVDEGREPALWLAIEKNPKKAMKVIERVLKDEESQGKSYNEVVDKMLAELEPQKQKAKNASDALRSAIAPQVTSRSSYIIGDKGLKTSLDFEKLSEYQKRLINDTKRELAYNQNVNLYTHNVGWGSYISPSSNPDMFLYLKSEDFSKMTDIMETMQRMNGGDGIFELSVLGSDKKAIIKIPAEELTREMKIIDTSMQAGIHPFLVDMTKYLDKHPETIKEVESSVGKINLSSVDSSIMEKINACK